MINRKWIGGFGTAVFLLICFFLGHSASQQQLRLDDIYAFYHGIALDRERRAIDFNDAEIRTLFFDLAREAKERNISQSEATRLIFSFLDRFQPADAKRETAEDIAALDFATSVLLDENDQDIPAQTRIRERLNLIRMVADSAGLYQPLTKREGLDERLKPKLDVFNAGRQKAASVKCDDPDVPPPPLYSNFLNGKGVVKIELDGNYSFEQHDEAKDGKAHPTDIFFYETTKPLGMCALLQRYKTTGSELPKAKIPKTVAAICQGKLSRKACFWQAKLDLLASNEILEHFKKYDDITSLDGWDKGEERQEICTTCHSGNDAFIQYRGTNLCHPKSNDSPEQHCFRNKEGQSIAVGFEHFKVKTFASTEGCASCHSIQTTHKSEYCKYLAFVTTRIMPPTHNHKDHPVKWGEKPDTGDDKLDQAIIELRESFCNGEP